MDFTNLKILLLGHTGLLGHVVARFLEEQGVQLKTISHYWPSSEYKKEILNSNCDVVINCAAKIPQRRCDTMHVNYELPEFLAKNFKGKIVHPASNIEDFPEITSDYAKSKRLGTQIIKDNTDNFLILKSSIIGPSLNGYYGIWDYVEKGTGTLTGYSYSYWNGITSLEWANLLAFFLSTQSKGEIPLASSRKINKLELISILAEKLKKQINIETDFLVKEDFCLRDFFVASYSIEDQIQQLIEWKKRF